jgi:hypothetical protein
LAYGLKTTLLEKPTDWDIDKNDIYNNIKTYNANQDKYGSILHKERECEYAKTCDGVEFDYSHTGVDYEIGSESALTVRASGPGQVVLISHNGQDDHGLGNVVVLEHYLANGSRIYTLYAHLDEIDTDIEQKLYKKGLSDGWVNKGDKIGIMGGTKYNHDHRDYEKDPSGQLGWPRHLHFEVKSKPTIGSPACRHRDFKLKDPLNLFSPYYGYTPDHPDECGYADPENILGNPNFMVIDPFDTNSKESDIDEIPGGDSPKFPEDKDNSPPVTDSDKSGKKPNLTVYQVAIEDGGRNVVSQLHINQSAHCKMRIKNVGSKDADGNIKTSCYLSDGSKIDKYPEKLGEKDVDDEQNTKGLDKGDTHTEHQHFTAPEFPGTYNIVICVDVRKKIGESNEKDNCSGEFVFSVVSDPNLTLTSIGSVDDRNAFNPGETVSIDVVAANTGENFGRDVRIGWFLSDGSSEFLIDTNNIKNENLKGGTTKTENLGALTVPNTPGKYYLKARVDYDGRVLETNESDNEIIFPFEVIGPPAPPPEPPPVTPPAGLEKGACPNVPLPIEEPAAPSALPPGKYAAIRFSNTGQHFFLKTPKPFGKWLYPPIKKFNPALVQGVCWNSNKAVWQCQTQSKPLNRVLQNGKPSHWYGLIPFADLADYGSWSLLYLNKSTNKTENHWIGFDVVDVPNASRDEKYGVTYGYYKKPEFTYDPSSKVISALFHDSNLSLLDRSLWPNNTVDFSQLTGRVLWNSDKDGWFNPFTPSQGVFQCDGEGSWELKIFNATPHSIGTISFELKDGQWAWFPTYWFDYTGGARLLENNNVQLGN